MDDKKLQHYFLLALLLGVIVFTFFILRPFIYTIILALVCATIFEPIHQKIMRLLHHKQGLAALATTIFIIITILVPFVFLGIKIFEEARQFYFFLTTEGNQDFLMNISNNLSSSFQNYSPFGQDFSIDVNQYINQGSAWLLNHFGYIFGSITKLLFNFFIFLIITFYVLKDGPKFKKIIINLSPLKDADDELIFEKIKIAINSVTKGSLIVAFIQGALTAVGFALFGVPHFMLWGVVATIASLVPGIGTAIVIVPAVIFIFLTGNTFVALGLLVWGMVVVGLIDNLLRPIFIGKGIKVHPLIVFLSVIGGIVFLGPIGFLLGPLTISLLFALLDIYTSLRVS